VVQSQATFVERHAVGRIGELVEADERLSSDQPDHVPEGPGVLIQHRLRVEEPLIPGHASGKITDRKGHVGDGRELGHGLLLSVR
jgi:hypothetical protein